MKVSELSALLAHFSPDTEIEIDELTALGFKNSDNIILVPKSKKMRLLRLAPDYYIDPLA